MTQPYDCVPTNIAECAGRGRLPVSRHGQVPREGRLRVKSGRFAQPVRDIWVQPDCLALALYKFNAKHVGEGSDNGVCFSGRQFMRIRVSGLANRDPAQHR
jgi:hypothetical protein